VIDPTKALASVPASLRAPLIECYREIVRNYIERRWEPAELNGGKFCEIVHTILQGALSGTYASRPNKRRNMVDACKALEASPANAARVGDRSLRILLPRLLPFLYEIRNNRNVGHVGGDVDPNHADAEAVLASTSWAMAELIRIFHNVSLREAQESVDALVERHHPLIWETEDIKRVLDPDMVMADQTLVLLYTEPGWVDVDRLFRWVEYSTLSDFKSKLLGPRHKQRLVELDLTQNRVKITPRGSKYVEDELLER
jgi:hypothetical protein